MDRLYIFFFLLQMARPIKDAILIKSTNPPAMFSSLAWQLQH